MGRAPGFHGTPIYETGVTPGGVTYLYQPGHTDVGYIDGVQYPMSYIYGLAAHTPTGAATMAASATPSGVEVQGAALGEKIAVIYGTDRVAGDIFFGPWANVLNPGTLTVGFGLGEGEIDSIVKVEAAGLPITAQTTTVLTALTSTGSQTVAPVSMIGINNGALLSVANVDGTNSEVVTVTAITGSTFTAIFGLTKTAGWSVRVPPGTSFTGFSGLGTFHFYPGIDAPVAADSLFTTIATAYSQTFDERFPGLAYVAAVFTYDGTIITGFPDIRWTVKGRKVLDPRLGVDANGIPNQPPVWSDNNMLCYADYRTNKYYGVGTPLSEIDWVSVAAIANWCDAVQSDGRKRFTFNATLRKEASHQANLDFIRSHFRCTEARVQGKYKYYVDAPALSVKVFDEVDRLVTNATNASPIVMTIPGHLRQTGDSVLISGVTGNTAANGRWVVTVIDANTLSLNGSTGNGTYLTGGAITANCRPLHRWRTPTEQIPTKIAYQWTDPLRDYQTATAPDISAAAAAGLVYTRTATYNGDGCRNAGQGQSQATYLLRKRGKDLNHSIICNRAEGLAMEMYDVCVLNLPSFGITGYYARIVRLTKFASGEFMFDFEEYDSSIYNEQIAGTQSKQPVVLPNPAATPPTPPVPTLTQIGADVRVDIVPPSPAYPYYSGTLITVQIPGGAAYNLAPPLLSGSLYIRNVTIGTAYTVTAYVESLAGNVSLPASATITPVLLPGMAIPGGKSLTVISNQQTITYDGNDVLSPTLQLTTFTAIKRNILTAVQWTMTRMDGTVLNPATYLSATTGDSVTMTAAAFDTARGGGTGVIVTATAVEIVV